MSSLSRCLFYLAMSGMLLPSPCRSEGPHPRDVQLSPSGQLFGRLVDLKGEPKPDTIVRLWTTPSGPPREIRTDAEGQFQYGPMTGGLVHVQAGSVRHEARTWAFGTAPPGSLTCYEAVWADPYVIRGQQPFCSIFGNEPLMIGILAAAAIAIPLAVHDSDDRPPGS